MEKEKENSIEEEEVIILMMLDSLVLNLSSCRLGDTATADHHMNTH